MPTLALEEDEIDDLLYFSRANEATELSEFLTALSTKYSTDALSITRAAQDPYSKNTILHYAAANGHVEILKLLCQRNVITPKQNDPTHKVSDAMLDEVSEPKNDAGNTPLHWAALNGRLDFVKALLDLNCDAEVKNNAGRTAAQEAEAAEKWDVYGLLIEKTAKPGEGDQEDEADSAEVNGDRDVNGNGEVNGHEERLADDMEKVKVNEGG